MTSRPKKKPGLFQRMADKVKRMTPRPAPPGVDVNLWCMDHDCCPHGVSYNKVMRNKDGREVHACHECEREIQVGVLSGKICAECHGTGIVVRGHDDSDLVFRALSGEMRQGDDAALESILCACEARQGFFDVVEWLKRNRSEGK